MGLAMKTEEKVPVKMPIMKTNEKSLITPAPKIYRAVAANSVVTLVSKVRGKTRLMARFIIERSCYPDSMTVLPESGQKRRSYH